LLEYLLSRQPSASGVTRRKSTEPARKRAPAAARKKPAAARKVRAR
jgi:hypothetical protein